MFNNLHIPEIKLNYAINILLNKSVIPEEFDFIDPNDFSTSTFLPLLKLVDKSKTINEITYIPIDYLRIKYKSDLDLLKSENLEFDSEIDEKEFLYKLLLKSNKINKNFLLKETYMNIPLFFFKKPILQTKLTNAKDLCFILYKQNLNLYNKIGYKYSNLHNKNIEIKNNSEENYLNVLNIDHFHKICNYMQKKDVLYSNIMVMSNGIVYQDFKNLKTDKRFIIGVLLINSHFLSFIIDKRCKSNNNIIKKHLYLFNSNGFKKNKVGYNDKFWFIESNMEIYKPESYFIKNAIYKKAIDFLDDEFKFDNIFLNKFKNQQTVPECGMYINYYNFLFYNRLLKCKNIDDFNFRDILLIYNNIRLTTSDLYMSMLRGTFYLTKKDLINFGINEKEYYDNTKIITVINKKYKELTTIYNNSLLKLKEWLNNIDKKV